jgi:hypothetical protein
VPDWAGYTCICSSNCCCGLVNQVTFYARRLPDFQTGLPIPFHHGQHTMCAWQGTLLHWVVALDKCPGVRPLRIGETWRCLCTKLILLARGSNAKE